MGACVGVEVDGTAVASAIVSRCMMLLVEGIEGHCQGTGDPRSCPVPALPAEVPCDGGHRHFLIVRVGAILCLGGSSRTGCWVTVAAAS